MWTAEKYSALLSRSFEPWPAYQFETFKDFSKKKIHKSTIRNQFLLTSSQKHRQFETDLDLFNRSNKREIDNPKLESSRFQDNLFNQAAGALNFSPDFEHIHAVREEKNIRNQTKIYDLQIKFHFLCLCNPEN